MATHAFIPFRSWALALQLAAAAALCGAGLGLAQAQEFRFESDPNGNLLAQVAANLGAPEILAPPQPQVVGPGELVSFLVLVADARDLTYQWRFNGTNIPGATADTLLLTNVASSNEGQYSVVLVNGSGSVTSAPAMLWFDGNGNGLPDSWELAYFGNLNQTATGDFDGDGVSNLQEFLDGTNPADKTSLLFRLTLLGDGGSVTSVPNQAGYTNGQIVTLTALPADSFHLWTGEVLTRSNIITLTMTNNKTIFAHFNPVDFVWTNLAGGDWYAETNWTPNLVPGTYDDAIVTNNVTVTLNAAADCAGLTLGNAVSAPTLAGNGTLTIHGTASWTAGTMTGGGRTVVGTGATLNLANISNLGLTSRTLENGGTVFWTGGGSMVVGGAIITNRAGALFAMQNASSIYWPGGGVARFDNAGTFRKSANAGTATCGASVGFNNYGLVEIQSGTLVLGGDGLNQGTINVSTGAGLNFASGTFTSSADSVLTGEGDFTVSGATAALAGLVNLSGTNTFSGGTANLTGNYTSTNNTLNIWTATVNFDGSGTVGPAILNLGLNGSLGGSNQVTIVHTMNWTNGFMVGSGRTVIEPGATLNLVNPGNVWLQTRTLENRGTVVWTGVGGLGLAGAVITNGPGALFDLQSAASLYWPAGGFSRFDNAGTFRKSINSGTASVDANVGLNNYGLVDLQSGALVLGGGGLNNGTITVPAGTLLNFSGGTFNASVNSSITGTGDFMASGATVTLAGLVNVGGTNTFSGGTASLTGNYICTNNTLNISRGTANFDGTGTVAPAILNLDLAGTLGGSNLVAVGQTMNWTNGFMVGSGRTTIEAGATLNLANPGNVWLQTRTLENRGTVVWTGAGGLGLVGAVITNGPGALFEMQSAASLYWPAGGFSRFDNGGTFRKSISPGTASVAANVSLNNYGLVDLQSGILAANGGFTSAPTAVLNCALGGTNAGAGYGQLRVAGPVALAGALSVELINGFVPDTNASFTVLSAGTLNGTFANFYYPSNAITMLLSNATTSVIVRVTGVATPRLPPILLTPALAGSNVLLTWTALSNSTYRLEFNPDLNPSNWNALPGDVIGASNTASKSDVLTPSNRFYRVRVLP